MRKNYWIILFAAAVLLLFFGNGSLLITDSVESNYALTAKEMVLSGDWLSPQIYGNYWYDKPVFFYWLTALAYKMFGFTEFASRFFPALFGLAGLGMICYGGSRLYGEKVGFYSGAMLLTSVEFFLISKSVITDAVLFFFFSATLLFFYLGYRDNRAGDWYAMYFSAGLAVLTKGPIGVLLPGLIIFLFILWQREWQVLRRCRLLTGILLTASVAVPWYYAMYLLHGSEFINVFFGVHNFLRASVSEHPRDDVIYYYIMVNILALFPWSMVLPLTFIKKWRRHELHLAHSEKYLLLWATVVFVFFQLMATKYITYTYPLLFLVFILSARFLVQEEEVLGSTVNVIFQILVYGALIIGAWWATQKELLRPENLLLLSPSLVAGVLLHFYSHSKTKRLFYGIGGISFIFYFALIQAVFIPLTEKRSAKDLGQLLQERAAVEVGLYGSYPTSAVFYSGSHIVKMISEEDLPEYLPKYNSWSSKNVMPYAIMERNKLKSVAIRKKDLPGFFSVNRSGWEIKGNSSRWFLLDKLV